MKKIQLLPCLILFVLPLLTSCGINKYIGTYDEYGVDELSESYLENRGSLILVSLREQKIIGVGEKTNQKKKLFYLLFVLMEVSWMILMR